MLRATLLTLATVWAASSLAAEVVVEKDIAYLGADRAEKLDLYRPAEVAAGQKFPGIVIIHGGGFTGGDKGAAREQNIIRGCI